MYKENSPGAVDLIIYTPQDTKKAISSSVAVSQHPIVPSQFFVGDSIRIIPTVTNPATSLEPQTKHTSDRRPQQEDQGVEPSIFDFENTGEHRTHDELHSNGIAVDTIEPKGFTDHPYSSAEIHFFDPINDEPVRPIQLEHSGVVVIDGARGEFSLLVPSLDDQSIYQIQQFVVVDTSEQKRVSSEVVSLIEDLTAISMMSDGVLRITCDDYSFLTINLENLTSPLTDCLSQNTTISSQRVTTTLHEYTYADGVLKLEFIGTSEEFPFLSVRTVISIEETLLPDVLHSSQDISRLSNYKQHDQIVQRAIQAAVTVHIS